MTTSSSIPFASFDQTSPLSTVPHDPMVSLASNCIRDYFGPTVQMVADALLFRGSGEPLTLQQLVQCLRTKCRQKVYSQERIRLLGEKVAARLKNQSLQLPPIRAALLVLVQHSIVSVVITLNKNTKKQHQGKVTYQYQFHLDRARLLPRYPRFVDYAKKALGEEAAALVEELLVQGRLRTVDAISKTVERLVPASLEPASSTTATTTPTTEEEQSSAMDDGTTATTGKQEEEDVDAKSVSPMTSTVQVVLDSFKRLAQAGFLEQVPKLVDETTEEEDLWDAGELEFEATSNSKEEPPTKKTKLQPQESSQKDDTIEEEDDRVIVKLLLTGSSSSSLLPRHAVWRVNVHMFHDSLRSFLLGRLVAERYGHKVQSAGSMITASLKYLAHRRHVEKITDMEEGTTFDAASIQRYIPKPVLQLLEKKRNESYNTTGGRPMTLVTQLSRALQQLASYKAPMCILEVETGAKPEDSRFEVCTTRMVQYLQQRIIHQMIVGHHGEVAARIVTILIRNGYLEADSLAEAAMVPAKDTREVRRCAQQQQKQNKNK
jgi:RNA polymerase III subunit RPC82